MYADIAHVRPSSLPDLPALLELQAKPQWVAWRLKDVQAADGTTKKTKPPVNPKIGGGASHSDPTTWGTYAQARVFALSRKMAGVGFVLSEDDGYTGVDLDKCRDAQTGVIEPWAAEIVAFAETYTEISPSGTGIRMIVRGKVEATVKCDPAHVEVYRSQRYLTVTGNHIVGTPTSIEPAPRTLAALMARVEQYRPKEEPIAPAADEPAKPTRAPLNFTRRERAAAPSKPAAARQKSDFWKNLRDATMNDTSWFRDLFPAAKFQPGTGGWRVASKYLGRNLEEDISVTPGAANGGIVDFGVADMGDKRLGKRTAVDLVMEWGREKNAIDAARWLCNRIGVTPEELGWRDDFEARENDGDDEHVVVDGVTIDPETGEVRGDARRPADGQPTRDLIVATPYGWPDPATIPPRQWLYGTHLIRRFVSVTGAPGGVGKSSLTIVEALSMISGRALLHGIAPQDPLNVWLVNLEDPIEETHRRIAAAMIHYGIRPEDCVGRLFVDSGRDQQIIVAKTERGGLVIQKPIVAAVKEAIRKNEIDVLIIDPFVASHRVSENDNTSMDAVAREWAGIANDTVCAIDLIHHVRKVGDVEITVEALRGASALLSAARSARVLNPMTREEAAKAGVENPRQFFRVNFGKSNMSLAAEIATWHQMKSVDLGNGAYPSDGDSIGVATEWTWPDPLDDVTAKDLRAVQNVVAGGQWRESVQAKEWVGHAVAEALDLDIENDHHKAKIKSLLKIWIKSGALIVVKRPDKNGDERPFVESARDDD